MARNIFDNDQAPKRSIKDVTLSRKKGVAKATSHPPVQEEDNIGSRTVSSLETAFNPDTEKEWEKEWDNSAEKTSETAPEATNNATEEEQEPKPAPKRAKRPEAKIRVDEPEEVPMIVEVKKPEAEKRNTFVRNGNLPPRPTSDQGVFPKNESHAAMPAPHHYQKDEFQVDIKDSMNTKSRKTATVIWGIIIALIVGFGAYAFFVPTSAKVDLTLQTVDSQVNETFKTEAATSTETAQLPLVRTKSLTITGTASLPLPPGGKTVEVRNKATGVVTLYNNTDKPFTLLINTRLESKDGRIYKTDKPVSIPAKGLKNGAAVPGSVEVGATASSTGAGYNLSNLDFTLPGLKGSDQYTTIYARSKTAFEGGFDGTTTEITEAQKATLKEQANSKLLTAILDGVKGNSNGEYIAFASDIALAPTYRQDAKSYIADQTITINAYAKADIEKIVGFNIGNTDKAVLTNQGVGVYGLSGNVQASGLPSHDKLVEVLRGISKTEAQKVLNQYPTIKEATISVSPFWKSTLPLDAQKITISEK